MLSVTSCDNLTCIDGDGIYQTELRDATAIDQIENYTAVDVVFTRSDTSGISVSADRNLLDNIVTEISGTTLVIKTNPGNSCFNYTQRPIINVSSPELNSIFLSGSGDFSADYMDGGETSLKLTGSGHITADSISCSELSAFISGSGNITVNYVETAGSDLFISGSGRILIEGVCSEGELQISGSGDIHAENFVTSTVSATISGSGDAYANVMESLTGLISGSGNLYVSGDPEINVTVTGSGRVIRE
jgi:hypothetical protein